MMMTAGGLVVEEAEAATSDPCQLTQNLAQYVSASISGCSVDTTTCSTSDCFPDVCESLQRLAPSFQMHLQSPGCTGDPCPGTADCGPAPCDILLGLRPFVHSQFDSCTPQPCPSGSGGCVPTPCELVETFAQFMNFLYIGGSCGHPDCVPVPASDCPPPDPCDSTATASNTCENVILICGQDVLQPGPAMATSLTNCVQLVPPNLPIGKITITKTGGGCTGTLSTTTFHTTVTAGVINSRWVQFLGFTYDKLQVKVGYTFECNVHVAVEAFGYEGINRQVLVFENGAVVADHHYDGIVTGGAKAVFMAPAGGGTPGSGTVNAGDPFPDGAQVCLLQTYEGMNRQVPVGHTVTAALGTTAEDLCLTIPIAYVWDHDLL